MTKRAVSRGRNESIIRVLTLAKRLDGLRYAPSLQQLADEGHVSTRTVRRDLQLLEALGFHVPMWRLNEQLIELRDRREMEA